jgi:hypothetical protein
MEVRILCRAARKVSFDILKSDCKDEMLEGEHGASAED